MIDRENLKNLIWYGKFNQNYVRLKKFKLAKQIKKKSIDLFHQTKSSVKQSLLTKSHNEHALEIEAQPPHMKLRPHHMDFS